MSTTYKILLVFLVSLLVVLSYLEAMEPDELNWSPSYTTGDKIPLGANVLYENLIDQDLQIRQVKLPPFEFLQDTLQSGTYFFLNDQISFHQSELKKLFSWIEKGNTAFLVADSFGDPILDTLNIKGAMLMPEKGSSSKPSFQLADARLGTNQKYHFDRETYQLIFEEYDTLQQTPLGYAQLHLDSAEVSARRINFLRDSIGKGALYVHTSPKTFSNYFLLQPGNEEYIEKVLAYLPRNQRLYWDAYYKSGKASNTSPLFVLLDRKALKWAYYFTIIGCILFILFEGKRKQRSIPVVEPLKNQSYQFARTVAGMYLRRKDYKAITTKKITLFLEYVRSQYRISTSDTDKNFYQRLAGLSGNTTDDVSALWNLMTILEKKEEIQKKELLELNHAIEEFKKQRHGK